MKIAVIYHTESGNTAEVAKLIKTGAEKVNDVDVKNMEFRNIDEDFVNEAKAVIMGTPTYLADFTWQLKKWFDKDMEIDLSDKLGAAFATARYVGGGAENSLKSLTGHMLVRGMIIYSGGAVEKPYTHFGAVCIQDGIDDQKERAEIFGERIANKAIELFS